MNVIWSMWRYTRKNVIFGYDRSSPSEGFKPLVAWAPVSASMAWHLGLFSIYNKEWRTPAPEWMLYTSEIDTYPEQEWRFLRNICKIPLMKKIIRGFPKQLCWEGLILNPIFHGLTEKFSYLQIVTLSCSTVTGGCNLEKLTEIQMYLPTLSVPTKERIP